MNNIVRTPSGCFLLLMLALAPVPRAVFAAACSDVFANAVGTTGGTLKLEGQPHLVNTGDHILATGDLQASGKNAGKICDNTACIASGIPAAVSALPTNSSNTDYNGSPLSFSAGDYYYDDFTLSGGQSINLVVTTGTVRIHVAGKLVIEDTKANTGGAPEDLVFLVAGDVELKDKAKVNALIFSEGLVKIEGEATQITGAVTGHSVEVKDKARVTYDPAAVDTADFNGFCSGTTGGSGDAMGFNCVVSGADPLAGHLYLQQVGVPFTFDVVALADSDGDGIADAIESGFAGAADRSVGVELVDVSTGAACAARPSLAPPVNQTLTFTAGDAGRRSAAAMTVNKAYRTLGCRVTDASASPAVVACSTDTFTVRPTELTLVSPTPGNAGATGGPKAVAGSTFSLSVRGGAGYTGTPSVDNTRLVAHTGAVQLGVLSGGFAAASGGSGTATGNDFSYSEVGNFRFLPQAVYDDTFATGDAANGDCTDDFSNTVVGGRFGCKFGNTGDTAWVGRFHPAQFVIAVQQQGTLAPGCGSFSYQGEDVPLSTSVVFRLTAQNLTGDTTANYTGTYAKLDGTDFVIEPVSEDGTRLGVDGVNEVTATWPVAGLRALTDNADGTHDLTVSGATFRWGRLANDLVAPFTTDLDLNVSSVTDDDGVTAVGMPVSATPGGVEMRYGRVALDNAHGSELQHLGVPMRVEYFAGTATGFVTNTADSCSSLAAVTLADLNPGDGLDVAETCVWDDDNDSGLACAGGAPVGMEYEPTAASGLFNFYLRAPGVGNTGVMAIQTSVPAHLQFDWLGAGNTDPSARATFGIFNRPSSIIFRREVR